MAYIAAALTFLELISGVLVRAIHVRIWPGAFLQVLRVRGWDRILLWEGGDGWGDGEGRGLPSFSRQLSLQLRSFGGGLVPQVPGARRPLHPSAQEAPCLSVPVENPNATH